MQRRRQSIFEWRQHEAGIGDGDRQRSGSRVDLHLAGEELALALQASLLVRFAPPWVADAFCAARLGGGGRVFGTLPEAVDGPAIVARALEI